MKYPRTSDFFYHIMSRHNLRARDIARITGRNIWVIYNYVHGYARPKKGDMETLAKHLHEDADVFLAMCYEAKDGQETGKPGFPKVRDEIIKNCVSRSMRSAIANTNGVHACEYFIAGFTYLLIEGKKSMDGLSGIEVLEPQLCSLCINDLEKDDEKRKTMFLIPGRWAFANSGLYIFENLPDNAPAIRFTGKIEDAVDNTTNKSLYGCADENEKNLLLNFRKLSEYQKALINETVLEKLAYTEKLKIQN